MNSLSLSGHAHAPQILPTLYHGTRSAARARAIVDGGFKRGDKASYTGTAVNLTPSVCMAWEYGPDRGGKILAVTLSPETRCEHEEVLSDHTGYDSHFFKGSADALHIYGGNIVLLWTVELARARVLTTGEIMRLAVAEWLQDGPEVAYNGDMGDLASLYWHGEGFIRKRMGLSGDAGVNDWKIATLARYKRLLRLGGVGPGDGTKDV